MKHATKLVHWLVPRLTSTSADAWHTSTAARAHWILFLINFCIVLQVVSSGKRLNWTIASIKDFCRVLYYAEKRGKGRRRRGWLWWKTNSFSASSASQFVLTVFLTFALTHTHIHKCTHIPLLQEAIKLLWRALSSSCERRALSGYLSHQVRLSCHPHLAPNHPPLPDYACRDLWGCSFVPRVFLCFLPNNNLYIRSSCTSYLCPCLRACPHE